MSTKILVITYKLLSDLVYEVLEILNLPIEVKVLEVDYRQIDVNLGNLSEFDLIITSGAHLEIIKKEFRELLYMAPIYPLQFSEADLIKALARAKTFGNKIILMYYSQKEYNLESYADLFNIEILRVPFSDFKDLEPILIKYRQDGFNTVIGTSGVCEAANNLNLNSVLIYSMDSLKMELMKAYQLASTRKKMMEYEKINKIFFEHSNDAVFHLDSKFNIIKINKFGIKFLGRTSKEDVVGRRIDTIIDIPMDINSQRKVETFSANQNLECITIPLFLHEEINGYITLIKNSKTNLNPKNNKTFTSKYNFNDIIVHSSIMKKVIVKSQQYAQSSAPIFILGESGTGKELLAHSIHQCSSLKDASFLPVNCAAIPKDILESELFGYEEGAFTGARKGGKPGYFELANGGTIFLDEIGDMPIETQTKLLRVLQEKEIIRLGGKDVIRLDVRIITATNKILPDLIKQNLFREDLYYRINVLQLTVPPLRDRKEDIVPLFRHLLLKYGLTQEQIEVILTIGKKHVTSYSWPGNIRELENFAQRISVVSSNITTATFDLAKYFEDEFLEYFCKVHQKTINGAKELGSDKVITDVLREKEKMELINTLMATNGSKSETAKKLGISRTTLWRKMNYFGII